MKGNDQLHQVAMTIAAVVVALVGVALLIAALLIPPPGEIHNSILLAFGELATFSGTLFGVGGKVVSR